jgi:hypothetical protein
MIDKNKKLTRVELDIVRLRHLAGLCNQQIANFLGLTLHQVKYRLKKPTVKEFVADFIWPHKRDTALCNIIYILENPAEAHLEQLKRDASDAMTYKWVGPGEKEDLPDLRKRLRALKMLGRIKGLYGRDKNLDRDWYNAVTIFVANAQEGFDVLMEARIEDYSERYEMWKEIKRKNEEDSNQTEPGEGQ